MLEAFVNRMIMRKVRRKNQALQARQAELREQWWARMPSRKWEVSNCVLDGKKPGERQANSRFFAKLPLELRRQVYESALGGNTIELSFIERPDSPTFGIRGNQPAWLFSFPQTCLLAYLESVEFIYTCNSFSTQNLACMPILPSFVTPPLLNTIRCLNIHFSVKELYVELQFPKYPPQNEEMWEEVWVVIANLRGLKVLKVHLEGFNEIRAETEAKLLEPLMKVRGLDNFQVSLNWRPVWLSDLSSLPFRLC